VSAPTDAALQAKFDRLAWAWRQQTDFLSSSTAIVRHPAYRAIVAMGEPAVPLILGELRQRGGHWFAALREITGENPVRREDWGRVDSMTRAWLDWGERRGLIVRQYDCDSMEE